MILPKSFYNRPTTKVAQDLLGCFLVRQIGKQIIIVKITETEAYCGPNDKASHASRGRTPRNEVMFGPAGVIYVYLIYGMYYMLNIVTEKKDYPAAVLIRAGEVMEIKNSTAKKDKKPKQNIDIAGPGKLTKFLQIDKSFNGLPIHTKKHGLWIKGRKEKISPANIVKAKRIGIDYAGEKWINKKWRFILN